MLAKIIKDYLATAAENYKAVRQRVEQKAAAANNGQFPTVDCYGRLHAPCDGYFWEEETHKGGAYLPLPADFWEFLEDQASGSGSSAKSQGWKQRVKVTIEEANAIKDECGKLVEVQVGKPWDDGLHCYVYITTSRSKLADLIADYRNEQEAAAKAQRDAERALKGAAPTGRITVKGTILAFKCIKREPRSYYDSGVDHKMLVKLENLSTVWGSQPSNLGDAEIGSLVEFSAAFEPTKDDPTHAFYKRPTKFKLLRK